METTKRLWPPTCHGRWMSEEYEPGLVSVIVPTYNRAHLITEAMDSVWAQTYRPIELIVVDDGSTDNTADGIKEWDSNHSDDPGFKLRYYRQENRGPSAARNLGAIHSRGEFIFWHDSDDVMLPNRVKLTVNELNKTGADMCAGGLAYVGYNTNQEKAVVRQTIPLKKHVDSPLKLHSATAVWSHRRSLLVKKGPWNESMRRFVDADFFYRCLLVEPPPEIGIVDSYQTLVRRHEDHHKVSSRTDRDVYEAFLTAIQELLELTDTLPSHHKLKEGVKKRMVNAVIHMAIQDARFDPNLHNECRLLVSRYKNYAQPGRDIIEKTLWRLLNYKGLRLYCGMRNYIYRLKQKLEKRKRGIGN